MAASADAVRMWLASVQWRTYSCHWRAASGAVDDTVASRLFSGTLYTIVKMTVPTRYSVAPVNSNQACGSPRFEIARQTRAAHSAADPSSAIMSGGRSAVTLIDFIASSPSG